MSDTPRVHIERDYRKPCTLCHTPRDVLVRCQIDESGTWHFLCPGSCWKKVSGGVIDGDQSEEHRFYRYGGMWKNKHEAVSAKKPKQKKKKSNPGVDMSVSGNASAEAESVNENTAESSLNEDSEPDKPVMSQHAQGNAGNAAEIWHSNGKAYTRHDKVLWENQRWICRKSHTSDDHWTPGRAYSLWKTED